MSGRIAKYQIATAIAILFHSVGVFGLLFFNKAFFLEATAGNLLLMAILLVWTQQGKNRGFLVFLASCFFGGMVIEMIGVRTGIFFGHYSYGGTMGFKILDTPLILGLNWFIVIYSSAASVFLLAGKIRRQPSSGASEYGVKWQGLMVIGGALLTVFYDWLMEPVAVKLGYWHWKNNGPVPLYNYVCWFIAATLLLCVFQAGKFNKLNKFAVNLMVIQLVFFLMLRIFLR